MSHDIKIYFVNSNNIAQQSKTIMQQSKNIAQKFSNMIKYTTFNDKSLFIAHNFNGISIYYFKYILKIKDGKMNNEYYLYYKIMIISKDEYLKNNK